MLSALQFQDTISQIKMSIVVLGMSGNAFLLFIMRSVNTSGRGQERGREVER